MMMCPHCNTAMQEVTKTGVLIGLCPTCRGVWLDRDELEKLLSQICGGKHEWKAIVRPLNRRREEYDDGDYEGRRFANKRRYHKERRWVESFDMFD